jgi:hypothetical protein
MIWHLHLFQQLFLLLFPVPLQLRHLLLFPQLGCTTAYLSLDAQELRVESSVSRVRIVVCTMRFILSVLRTLRL